jgi:hypothetical protein
MKEENIPDIPDADFQIIVETWVNTFWDIGKQAKIAGNFVLQPPTVQVAYSVKERGALGLYYQNSHSILINTFTWDPNERNKLLDLFRPADPEIFLILAQTNSNKSNKIWQQVFGFFYPSSTLIHELEHARRGTGHIGSHDSIYISLFPDDKPKERTFEQSANAVYEKILSYGFAAKFMENYKRNLAKQK